jgi:hypothetical protein
MEPTEEELERHFASMDDEQLRDASSKRLTLTSTAQHIVEREVNRRGLPLPQAEPEPDSPPDTEALPDHWVTVERFRDLSAAIVARSALEASEIPCFLRDENTVRMDWQISNFIGGMRLQVREQDQAAASTVLTGLAIDELPDDATVEEPRGENCPSCAGDNVHREFRFGWFSVAMVFLFGIPAPQGKRRRTCTACGKQRINDTSD